jgi:hypothetical protein
MQARKTLAINRLRTGETAFANAAVIWRTSSIVVGNLAGGFYPVDFANPNTNDSHLQQ